MSKKSNRNRHTGRINAAKRRILETGETVKSKDGRIYKAAYFGVIGRRRGPTLVRDFDAERKEAQQEAV